MQRAVRNNYEREEVKYAYSQHDKVKRVFEIENEPIVLKDGLKIMAEWVKKPGHNFTQVVFAAVEVKKNLFPAWERVDLLEKNSIP